MAATTISRLNPAAGTLTQPRKHPGHMIADGGADPWDARSASTVCQDAGRSQTGSRADLTLSLPLPQILSTQLRQHN